MEPYPKDIGMELMSGVSAANFAETMAAVSARIAAAYKPTEDVFKEMAKAIAQLQLDYPDDLRRTAIVTDNSLTEPIIFDDIGDFTDIDL